MKKVVILNTHSTLNSGDTAIVIAQIQLINNFIPNASIAITSRTSEIDQAFYKPFGVTVLPPIFPAPSVFSPTSKKIKETVKNLFSFSAKKQLINTIETGDLIISSGGGYFWSPAANFPGPMFLQNIFHIQIALYKKKPLFFFPQSFGPFQNSWAPKLLSKSLQSENVIKIFAREKISFDIARNLVKGRANEEKVTLCPDLAFALDLNTLPLSIPINLDLPRPRIAITLRNWDFPNCLSHEEKRLKFQKYLTVLKKTCLHIYNLWKGSIILFPQVRGPGEFENDVPITKKFFGELGSIIPPTHLLFIRPTYDSPLLLIQLLSQIDLILATRFHSAIFSLISGTPAISIGYQHKSKGIMYLLGFERYCIEIDDIPLEQLLQLIEEILNNHQRIKSMITKNVAQIKHTILSTLAASITPLCF
jgi:colanic acid/amylovoran biosynthesis protein